MNKSKFFILFMLILFNLAFKACEDDEKPKEGETGEKQSLTSSSMNQ